MPYHFFSHPEPQKQSHRIHPVFMPFAGCPRRCVFCAQPVQTATPSMSFARAYDKLEQELKNAAAEHARPFELAFYGGTFTAIATDWQEKFLALGRRYHKEGLVSAMRCSTRPDALGGQVFERLHHYGLNTIELGIQSFSDAVLSLSGRGYSGDCARSACRNVQEAGFTLGIQLLPALPKQSDTQFLQDVQEACELAPKTIRLYPCLVIEDTELAEWWKAGTYTPWSMEHAVTMLGKALPIIWQHGITCIRTGVAYEKSLADAVLAGPYHEAFGSMVRGEALYTITQTEWSHIVAQGGKKLLSLRVPRHFQGEFWGYKGALRPRWEALGVHATTVIWGEENTFRLEFAE